MEAISRFDIADYNSVSMIVVENDLLPSDPSVVVIPFLPDYPAVEYLNHVIRHEGQDLVLATRLIASLRRFSLRRTGHVADQGGVITRAVNILMAGV